MNRISKIMSGVVLALCMAGTASAAVVDVNADIAVSTTWSKTNEYRLKKQIYVLPGATLIIPAGTKVLSLPADEGSLAVCRGAKIYVNGTETEPVIMSSTNDTTSWREAANEWGNLTIMGKGLISASHYGGEPVGSNTPFPSGLNEKQMEGLVADSLNPTRGMYGGNDDNDNSGAIHYLSLRYGGKVVGFANELNGLSLGGIGRETDIDHVEVMNNIDDGIEIWGGAVNLKYLSIWNVGDDSFDVDEGWRGKAQFVFIVQGYSVRAAQGSGTGDNAFETDGAEDSDAQPVTTATIYNATVIGMPGSTGGDHATAWRDNARVQYRNSLFMDLGEALVKNDNIDTDGAQGYGHNSTLSWANTWTTPHSHSLDISQTVNACDDASPSVCVSGMNYPADLYKTQVDGNLAEIKDSVFYNNVHGTAYTEATAVGVFNSANNNVTASTMPIAAISRATTPVSYTAGTPAVTYVMIPVTTIDPRAANDAATSVGMAPADGFFTPAKFRGAFSPSVNWLLGWTASSAYGYHAGQTNPVNPTTESVITEVKMQNSFPTVAGKIYTLEESLDMLTWVPIASVVGDGSVYSWTATTATDPNKFYRTIIQ